MELDHTNLIFPEPCTFVSKTLPACSVIRPTSTEQGGAVAIIKAFTDDLLFFGQSTTFFDVVNRLAVEADTVPGGFRSGRGVYVRSLWKILVFRSAYV